MAREITIVSYNVHGCRGTDGLINETRVAGVIRALDADIVGLQEVDCRRRHPDGGDQLARLAAETQLWAVPGPTIRDQTGYFGNAVLTRHPVIDVTHTDLSFQQREPRGMINVLVSIAASTLRVVVTHFGLHAQERRHQVNVVLDVLRREHAKKTPPSDALVLLGDFNEWKPRAVTLARLHEALGRTPPIRTFPSRFPLFALDRIWVRPRQALLSVRTARGALARRASDHLPLHATLDSEKFSAVKQ